MFPYDERAALLEQCRVSSKKEGLVLETAVDLWCGQTGASSRFWFLFGRRRIKAKD